MRTVTFKSVLHGSARLLGLNPDRLDTIKAAQLVEYINQHVRFGWPWDWWSEWTLVEQRFYRAAWAVGTTYGAPTATATEEIFYFPAGKYYQSLVAGNLGNVPATLSGADYVENSSKWAESAGQYDTTPWTANTAFTVGQQRVNPDNGRAYQCHTAHTSGATFDTTKFGILTPFNRYIAYSQSATATVISQVKDAYKRDPRVFPKNPGRLKEHWKSDLGIQARDDWPEFVYLEFMTTPPVFTTTPWADATSYAVGDLVYSAPETYRCTTAHTSSGTINLSNFTLVQFPYLLGDFVKRAALSDYQEGLKLTQRSRVNEDRSRAMLADIWDQEFPMQGQSQTARVATYA